MKPLSQTRLGPSRAIVLIAVLASGAIELTAAPPARTDNKSLTTYFVHGISAWTPLSNPLGFQPSSDCVGTWGAAKNEYRRLGWTGRLRTVAYYAQDKGCDVRIGIEDLDTPILELGRELAWEIYASESQYGRSVDIVAHSMGGLIVAAAISGTARRPHTGVSSSWPPFIYVMNVVTLSTPFQGTSGTALACVILNQKRQCWEMFPGSSFLSWLFATSAGNFQAAGGTDWTLIGADDDDFVPTLSALGMNAGHYVWYFSGQALEHTQITNSISGRYSNRWQNYYNKDTLPSPWQNQFGTGLSAIDTAFNACYYWWRW